MCYMAPNHAYCLLCQYVPLYIYMNDYIILCDRVRSLEYIINQLQYLIIMYPTKEPHDVGIIRIKDIQHSGVWINIRARPIQLWEPNSDSISQVGLLADRNFAYLNHR